jgi:hypothetical protein
MTLQAKARWCIVDGRSLFLCICTSLPVIFMHTQHVANPIALNRVRYFFSYAILLNIYTSKNISDNIFDINE